MCVVIIGFAFCGRCRRTVAPEPIAVAVADWPRPVAIAARGPLWVALGAGVIGALVVRPWVGLVVGFVTFVAARRPLVRTVMRFAPFVIVAGIAVYVPLAQYIRRYPPHFDWPTYFSAATIPAWIAVLLLLADAMLNLVGRPNADNPALPESDGAP